MLSHLNAWKYPAREDKYKYIEGYEPVELRQNEPAEKLNTKWREIEEEMSLEMFIVTPSLD